MHVRSLNIAKGLKKIQNIFLSMNIVLTLQLIKSQPQSAHATLVSTQPLIQQTPVAFPALERIQLAAVLHLVL